MKPATKDDLVSFRLSSVVKKALVKLANKRNMTLSEYVSDMVTNQVEK